MWPGYAVLEDHPPVLVSPPQRKHRWILLVAVVLVAVVACAAVPSVSLFGNFQQTPVMPRAHQALPPLQPGARAPAPLAAPVSIAAGARMAAPHSASQRSALHGYSALVPLDTFQGVVVVADVDNMEPADILRVIKQEYQYQDFGLSMHVVAKLYCGKLSASWGMRELENLASGQVHFFDGNSADSEVRMSMIALDLSEAGAQYFLFASKKPGRFAPLVQRLRASRKHVIGVQGCTDSENIRHQPSTADKSKYHEFVDMTRTWLC